MKEKLDILCQTFNINASELAKSLDVEASAISHIKSGRNKPRYDFLVKILRTYPMINPDWLLLDSDQVLREGAAVPSGLGALPLPDDASLGSDDLGSEVATVEELHKPMECSNVRRTEESYADSARSVDSLFSQRSLAGKRVERVIILYSDKSFESYTPTEK